MRNSSKLLALGLVLFLGACSAAEGDFLKKVENKTAYLGTDATGDNMGTFSADGKTLGEGDGKMTFVEASDDSTATYKGGDAAVKLEVVYSFKTSDGKSGTMAVTSYKVDGKEMATDEDKKPEPIFLK